jgi:hypothetical protein
MLGILGLGAIFVQVNELITFYLSFVFLWKSDNIKLITTKKSTTFQIVLPKAIFINGWNKIANPI